MLRLPSLFVDILQQDPQLHAAVLQTYRDMGVWISNSRTPFFPHYTDHGIQHIDAVLKACDSLITAASVELLTPADVAVLAIAVLLHDSALHLAEDGVLSLLGETRLSTFDKVSWDSLWQEFWVEARRFDQRQLVELLGRVEPVREPRRDPSTWRESDYLLIGEFIRRHHPRIAHEIALFGVPGPSEQRLRISGVDREMEDMAGFIARSHGLNLRSTFEHLQREFNDRREYRGIHLVYLMCLLRIADVLRIEADRAPRELTRIRRITSPISAREWRAHWAVRDIRYTHDDPEAVFIDVMPPNVRTYLRVARWLVSIQEELDRSWAALGEVYGPSRSLSAFGLTLRRVRSTLDESQRFAELVTYIPRPAYFDTAGAELLRLLVGPLYQWNVGIAIREMVQNSVDAVRQRAVVDHEYQIGSGTDVVVRIFKRGVHFYVEVMDRGIGMTADEICEYFLKAGASLRTDPTWYMNYVDRETGSPVVLRTGRFGIGALAAFLLGDEIKVSTRSYREERGVAFSGRLEQESIELKKIDRSIGTTIRIKISRRVLRALRSKDPVGLVRAWEWYHLSSPRVSYRGFYRGKPLHLAEKLPLPQSDLQETAWHRIEVPDFADVMWTYRSEFHEIYCNGFKVPRPFHSWMGTDSNVPLKTPTVSVFDPDGHLPLSLDRNSVAGALPFTAELLADVMANTLAFLLLAGPKGAPTDPNHWNEWFGGLRRCPALRFVSTPATVTWSSLFATSTGFGFVDEWNLYQLRATSILGVISLEHVETWHRTMWGREAQAYQELTERIRTPRQGIVIRGSMSLEYLNPSSIESLGDILDGLLGTDNSESSGPMLELGTAQLQIRGVRFLLPAALAVLAGEQIDLEEFLQSYGIVQVYADPAWIWWEWGTCPTQGKRFYPLLELQDFAEPGWSGIIAEYFPIWTTPQAEPSSAARAWSLHIGDAIVPYDPRAREPLIEDAQESLKAHLTDWAARLG